MATATLAAMIFEDLRAMAERYEAEARGLAAALEEKGLIQRRIELLHQLIDLERASFEASTDQHF